MNENESNANGVKSETITTINTSIQISRQEPTTVEKENTPSSSENDAVKKAIIISLCIKDNGIDTVYKIKTLTKMSKIFI